MKMVDEYEKILDIAKNHIDEIVLVDISGPKKLLGVLFGDDDYYWVFLDHKKGLEYHSVLCNWIGLKGSIKDEEYEYLKRIFYLNLEVDMNEIEKELLVEKRKSKLNYLKYKEEYGTE